MMHYALPILTSEVARSVWLWPVAVMKCSIPDYFVLERVYEC